MECFPFYPDQTGYLSKYVGNGHVPWRDGGFFRRSYMNAQSSSARSSVQVQRGRAEKSNFRLQHSLHFQRDFLYELRIFILF